jgi:hypothetical protein
MHFIRFSAFLLLALLVLVLWRCGVVAQLTFEGQCKKVAGIDIANEKLWHQYLLERKRTFVDTKVTVNGVEIEPTDLWPVITTPHFRAANDWVLDGKPMPKNVAFRNDEYIFWTGTGERVAHFRNLRLRYDTIETTMSMDCTINYPELYTGSRAHRGTIVSMSR